MSDEKYNSEFRTPSFFARPRVMVEIEGISFSSIASKNREVFFSQFLTRLPDSPFTNGEADYTSEEISAICAEYNSKN